MKSTPSKRNYLFTGLFVVFASLFLFACGTSENPMQKQAYENALKLEQSYTFETAEAILVEYRKVIAIEPGTRLAEKAETHLKAVEERLKADEQHKSVFHEHGID